MENGKPMLINDYNNESMMYQIKNNPKIPTQQQWNNMIKKRHMKREVKELRRKDSSYHYRRTNNNCNNRAYGKPMNHLNHRPSQLTSGHAKVHVRTHKQTKDRVNKKVMKNNRTEQRRSKLNRMCPNHEFAFMTANNDKDRINNASETSLLSNELSINDIENNDEYWIGDTGATTHITNYPEGIYNCAYPTGETKVIMGNGTKVTKDKIGTLIGKVIQKDVNDQRIELKSVVVSSQVKFNLLSLTALMRVGWQLHGDARNLVLTKIDKQIKFTHTVRTQKGMLFVIRIKRTLSE